MEKIQIVASCESGAKLAKFTIIPATKINVTKTYANIDQAADTTGKTIILSSICQKSI